MLRKVVGRAPDHGRAAVGRRPAFMGRRGAGLLLALAALTGGVQAQAQSADLVLPSHVVTPDPTRAGGEATFVITVGNNGPDAASNVVLTDMLPPGAASSVWRPATEAPVPPAHLKRAPGPIYPSRPPARPR